jgi:hypothetical protein
VTASIADLVINSTSKQYVRVAVTELTGANPTTDNVYMAFPATGGEPTTFITGSWLTLSGIYYALCLVGPGAGIALSIGFYDVYVKISDNPEVPILLSGLLEVT